MKTMIKKCLKEYIEEKCKKINFKNFNLKTIFTNIMNKMLIISVKHSNLFFCNLFLKIGADINCKDNNGKTLIQLIIDDMHINGEDTEESLLERKIEMLNFLFNNGIDVNNKSNAYTALQQACKSNNIKFIKELIGFSKVNLRDSKGNTALLTACKNDNIEAVQELLKNNVNIKIPDLEGVTPLHAATKNRNLLLVNIFISIDKNIINAKDINGDTPLMYACNNQCIEVIKKLLESGANPNLYNAKGETAVHIAFHKNNFDILDLLIRNNANINEPMYKNNETILHVACKDNKYTDWAMFLVQKGANVNAQTNDGWTPLHYTCSNNNYKLTEFLIHNGADVFAKTTENILPLCICLEKKYYHPALLLISANNNLIHERYDYNWGLIHYAARNNWYRLVNLLYELGVNLEDKTRDNLTPIDIAKMHGHNDIVIFLREKIQLKRNRFMGNAGIGYISKFLYELNNNFKSIKIDIDRLINDYINDDKLLIYNNKIDKIECENCYRNTGRVDYFYK